MHKVFYKKIGFFNVSQIIMYNFLFFKKSINFLTHRFFYKKNSINAPNILHTLPNFFICIRNFMSSTITNKIQKTYQMNIRITI